MFINKLDITKYQRCFTFGDSYTKYYWPTYPDIIKEYIPETHNWGLKGAGNHYIFNSVFECNQRYKFNSDDLVIVMWTGETREDRYVDNQWLTAATTYRETLYGSEWIRKFGSEIKGNLIRDYAYIKAVKVLLEQSCDYTFLSSIPLSIDYLEVNNLYNDITIKDSLYLRIKDTTNRPNFNDPHPTVTESLDYINNQLDCNIKYSQLEYWEQQIRAIKTRNTLANTFIRETINRL